MRLAEMTPHGPMGSLASVAISVHMNGAPAKRANRAFPLFVCISEPTANWSNGRGGSDFGTICQGPGAGPGAFGHSRGRRIRGSRSASQGHKEHHQP